MRSRQPVWENQGEHWKGCQTQGGKMKELDAMVLAQAFLWLTTLAAAMILFWGSDRLWMMAVILLASGWTSVGIVRRRCHRGD